MDADAGPNDEEEEREWWQSVELHAGSAQIRWVGLCMGQGSKWCADLSIMLGLFTCAGTLI